MQECVFEAFHSIAAPNAPNYHLMTDVHEYRVRLGSSLEVVNFCASVMHASKLVCPWTQSG